MDENQILEEENIFDDFEPEETPAEEEKPEPVEETVETPVEPTPYLKVKYNGEEKDLTEDEARTYAQKGMNYDRFYGPLERLARLNEMSVDGYLNQLNETQFNYEVSKEIENMKSDPKYENVSDEVLQEIASSRITESLNLRDKNYEEQSKKEADAESERINRDVEKFLNEYPEFRDKGPEEVLNDKIREYVSQGYTLLEAYNKWSRENPAEKVSKLNEENKKRSLGNTTSVGSADTDDFLSGFLKG